MITASIVINQAGKITGAPGVSRDDLSLGSPVNLSNGGNAASGGSGGAGGSLGGQAGSAGTSGGGGGGGRIKLFHAAPGTFHLVAPAVDVAGGSGGQVGGSGTYSALASVGALDGRKIYQEGGLYRKRMRAKLL